jgi:hypothetical protein
MCSHVRVAEADVPFDFNYWDCSPVNFSTAMIKPTVGHNAVLIPSTSDACSFSSEGLFCQNSLCVSYLTMLSLEGLAASICNNCSKLNDILQCHIQFKSMLICIHKAHYK